MHQQWWGARGVGGGEQMDEAGAASWPSPIVQQSGSLRPVHSLCPREGHLAAALRVTLIVARIYVAAMTFMPRNFCGDSLCAPHFLCARRSKGPPSERPWRAEVSDPRRRRPWRVEAQDPQWWCPRRVKPHDQ